MCGNGGRCIVSFARSCGIVRDHYRFRAADGFHEAVFLADGTVRLRMSDVESIREVGGKTFTDTGSPHVVEQVHGLDAMDVFSAGRLIRNSAPFVVEGTNVNFVELAADGMHVRTYERGVEDETYACGTGVTAVALVAASKGWIDSRAGACSVRTRGGWLRVCFQKQGAGYSDIWLEGPAVKVFEGTISGF